MSEISIIIITSVTSMVVATIGSSGVWAYVMKRGERKSAWTQLLLGMARDRIVHLGLTYIDRGYITKDEYDDYRKYLCNPYSEFGGNGLADRIMTLVDNLPISKTDPLPSMKKENKNDNG